MKELLDRFLLSRKSIEHKFELFYGGNSTAPNILVLTEYINATYYISFDIPLRALYAKGLVNFAVMSQKQNIHQPHVWKKWKENFKPDVVIMSRYGEKSGPEILTFFQKIKVPVIYHIDDDLLSIPKALGPEIEMCHGDPAVVAVRRYLLANCDLIYASTQVIAQLMQQRFPSQSVYYGIHAPYMNEIVPLNSDDPPPYPIIGYMGSKGHQLDLEMVVPSIARLMTERDNLHFELFGTVKMPSALLNFGSRVKSIPVEQSYIDFLSTLASLKWSIGLAPLEDSLFNRCRSPTKFIEYTSCHIPTIASNIPVYADVIPKSGGILVTSNWYKAISLYLDNPVERKKAVQIAQKCCDSQFGPERLQQQLINILLMIQKRRTQL